MLFRRVTLALFHLVKEFMVVLKIVLLLITVT